MSEPLCRVRAKEMGRWLVLNLIKVVCRAASKNGSASNSPRDDSFGFVVLGRYLIGAMSE